MSVLAAGGGLRMGQVIGSTDARAEAPVTRVMDSNCLLATLYECFGIDRHHQLRDRNDRPLEILPTGKPIDGLL